MAANKNEDRIFQTEITMAKTTGKIKGNIRMLYMDDILVGCTTANALTVNNEQVESTCKTGDDPPPRTYESGVQDWSMSGTLMVRFDDANQYSRMAAAAKAATEHTFKFATPNADDPYWQGVGFLTEFSETGSLNEMMTADFSVSPKGSIYFFNT